MSDFNIWNCDRHENYVFQMLGMQQCLINATVVCIRPKISPCTLAIFHNSPLSHNIGLVSGLIFKLNTLTNSESEFMHFFAFFFFYPL